VIDEMEEYYANVGLRLNANKTKIMYILTAQKRKTISTPDIHIGGTDITPCSSLKVLGFTINENMECNEQVDAAVKK
jgi:hypothetical protein